MGPPAPHVLFSAHGLPQKYIDDGDPYRTRSSITYRAVAEGARCRASQCSLAFQSRVGPREWLRPYTEDHLARARPGRASAACSWSLSGS